MTVDDDEPTFFSETSVKVAVTPAQVIAVVAPVIHLFPVGLATFASAAVLIAVILPLGFVAANVERLFREFAVVLAAIVGFSTFFRAQPPPDAGGQAVRDRGEAEPDQRLAGRRYLVDQVRVQQALLEAQRERLRLIGLRFTDSFSEIIDVLDARREILDTEQPLVQPRRAQRSKAVTLYTTLGAGLLA